mgnify:CR=1 FL=1
MDLESRVSRLEERTKRLDKMEAILEDIRKDIKDFRNDIPKGETLATKDFVKSEVKSAKIWIIVTALGTGITLLRLFLA